MHAHVCACGGLGSMLEIILDHSSILSIESGSQSNPELTDMLSSLKPVFIRGSGDLDLSPQLRH